MITPVVTAVSGSLACLFGFWAYKASIRVGWGRTIGVASFLMVIVLGFAARALVLVLAGI